MTGEIGTIFRDEEIINNILDGCQPVDDLDIPDYAKDWFKALVKTPAEWELPKLDSVASSERYAKVFKEAKEKNCPHLQASTTRCGSPSRK